MENTRIGPFQVCEPLGRNRRSQVFRAVHEEQGREIAIKFVKIPPDIDQQQAVEKIHHETEILKRLRNPGLVRVYGAGVEKNKIFFAYELVQGEPLAAFLTRRGRIATDQAVDIGKQIALVLEYLHENEVIHGKLTPDKVLMQDDGKIKIADLRLNRSKRKRWDSARKNTLETAAYLAPELFTGQGPSAKTDFYSLGVILFEMLTGKLPFEPENMARLVKKKMTQVPPLVSEHLMNCPFWLDKVVSQLMQPDPKLRAFSAKAVTMALDQVQRIDQTKQTAAEQMTAGFTALNAGVDKSEARKALGQKTKKKKVSTVPFYKTTIFLVFALFAMFAIFTFTLMPTSNKKLLAQSKELMESSDPVDWQRARNRLKKIMDRSNAGEYGEEAEELYYLSKRMSLVSRVKRGLFGLEAKPVKRFAEAYDDERARRYESALERYQFLVADLDPEGKHRDVYEEASQRVEDIKVKLEEEKKARAELRVEFVEKMKKAKAFAESEEPDKAREIYTELLASMEEDDKLAPEIEQVKKAIEELSDE